MFQELKVTSSLLSGGIAFIPEDSRQGDCTGIRCSGSERNVLECEINSDIGGDNDAGVECTRRFQ